MCGCWACKGFSVTPGTPFMSRRRLEQPSKEVGGVVYRATGDSCFTYADSPWMRTYIYYI